MKTGKTSDNKSPGDRAWQNELTEEDEISPELRDDESMTLNVDPDIVNEEPVKPARGKSRP